MASDIGFDQCFILSCGSYMRHFLGSGWLIRNKLEARELGKERGGEDLLFKRQGTFKNSSFLDNKKHFKEVNQFNEIKI